MDKEELDYIREEAARWVVRFNSVEVSSQEREEFADWLVKDPLAASEFEAMSAVWVGLDDIDQQNQINHIKGLAVKPVQEKNSVKPSGIFLRRMSIAAGLLLVIFAGLFATQFSNGDIYSTAVGETETVKLEDGSIIYLNTNTKIRVDYTGERRHVTLFDGGEALFDVARDIERPFWVEAGNGRIRVYGTTFNVFHQNSLKTVVTVLEGIVGVEDAKSVGGPKWEKKLTANQEISYQKVGIISSVSPVTSEKEVTWINRRLILEGKPLVEIIQQLNRYSERTITLDPQIHGLKMGGVISTRNIDAALEFLEKVAPIVVDKTNNSYHLSAVEQ